MSFNNWTKIEIKKYDIYNVEKIESNAINIAIIQFPKDKNLEKIRDMLTTPLGKPGIYILKSLDIDGIRKIYTGQTKNGLFERIKDPNHFWNIQKNIYSVLYIYSVTNPFSGDDLIFFEGKFIESLKKLENEKCRILNGNNGNQPIYKNDSLIIHEKTILFKSIINLIERLDNNYFLELQNEDDSLKNPIEKDIYLTAKNEENISSDIITIYPKNNRQFPFKFNKKNSKVLIPKGTPINTNILERSRVESIARLIKKLEQENCIKNNEFTEDVWINKPSPAAGIIQGSSTDGWLYWVTEDNEPINIFRNVDLK